MAKEGFNKLIREGGLETGLPVNLNARYGLRRIGKSLDNSMWRLPTWVKRGVLVTILGFSAFVLTGCDRVVQTIFGKATGDTGPRQAEISPTPTLTPFQPVPPTATYLPTATPTPLDMKGTPNVLHLTPTPIDQELATPTATEEENSVVMFLLNLLDQASERLEQKPMQVTNQGLGDTSVARLAAHFTENFLEDLLIASNEFPENAASGGLMSMLFSNNPKAEKLREALVNGPNVVVKTQLPIILETSTGPKSTNVPVFRWELPDKHPLQSEISGLGDLGQRTGLGADLAGSRTSINNKYKDTVNRHSFNKFDIIVIVRNPKGGVLAYLYSDTANAITDSSSYTQHIVFRGRLSLTDEQLAYLQSLDFKKNADDFNQAITLLHNAGFHINDKDKDFAVAIMESLGSAGH